MIPFLLSNFKREPRKLNFMLPLSALIKLKDSVILCCLTIYYAPRRDIGIVFYFN